MHATRKLQALGRLKPGQMNGTERRYAEYLRLRQAAGEIVWHRFEGIKLRLADNTFYSPDFVVMRADGAMELHEVKGSRRVFQDDAKVKVKLVAEMYPFPVFVAFPRDREALAWEFDIY